MTDAACTLAKFQRDFAKALLAPDASGSAAIGALTRQPAFQVYRNTVMKGCVDALAANFPTVLRLVGAEWFGHAAALHVQAEPPCDGRLLTYGAGFPAFLASFEPAAQLTYLADVARLDALWVESHTAAASSALNPALLARCSPEVLGKCKLKPHPAARWAWFDSQPIATIWLRNRPGMSCQTIALFDDEPELAWQPEGMLLTRAEDTVAATMLARADAVFLDQCALEKSLGDIAEFVLEEHPDANLAAIFERLLLAGAFAAQSSEALFQPRQSQP